MMLYEALTPAPFGTSRTPWSSADRLGLCRDQMPLWNFTLMGDGDHATLVASAVAASRPIAAPRSWALPPRCRHTWVTPMKRPATTSPRYWKGMARESEDDARPFSSTARPASSAAALRRESP